MNPKLIAIIGLRLLAVGIFMVAVWQLLAGLLNSLNEINPSYLGYFFQKVLVGPLLGLLLGGLLWGASRRLGRWLTRDLDS